MNSPVVISRAEARAAGLKRYFTGEPCKRGHVEECSVSNALCLACGREMKREKWAKDPESARSAQREYRSANKEIYSRAHRKWRLANPDKYHSSDRRKWHADVEESRRRRREERAAKAEGIRARDRARYAANPKPKLQSVKRWAAENTEKVLASQRNIRATRRGVGGKHTARDILEIKKSQNGKCAYCKTKLDKKNTRRDHVTPIARGGTNNRDNIQLLCAPCNLRKSARDPLEFARSIGFLL